MKRADDPRYVVFFIQGYGNQIIATVPAGKVIKAGEALEIKDAWSLHNLIRPLQNGSLQQIPKVMPMHCVIGAVPKMTITPMNWYEIDDCGDSKRRYHALIEEVEEGVRQHRARESGISLANKIPPQLRRPEN